ncbi:hypothetical protein EV643_12298 [Kribbella sp. VKM Ac-2527]|uniref:Uncharacterized protein n=1 Tax=Kribbella caucasensis TaxID=2512215 RepID=A0A4R6JJ79_9ACTN|nr:hypothetical protein [Kribbella sp. VKM Ac-2527]TDO35687.1 hypothetical protein EV643_12298 [Kribbella sp. VKM Ac-2527]
MTSIALLVGTTACSNDNPPEETPSSEQTPAAVDTPSSEVSTVTPTEVISRLSGAGYTCGRDGDYAICTTGAVAVWVLTGNHTRPPVVSLHSEGSADVAAAAIGKVLPQALELAQVSPAQPMVDWFGEQADETAAQTTEGDWQIDWSVEVDSEEPGAHLSLMDKLCTANCQAE